MANSDTLFLTAKFLKNNTVIDQNVDDDILNPWIIVAQNKYIERSLGTALFNDIVTNIKNKTITGLNKTLLDDYIQPCLQHFVVYEALPFIQYKLTNKSISKKNSENSTVADLNEMQYLRKSVLDTASYMQTRLVEYLQTEVANGNFTLYSNPGSDASTITPDINTYFNGLYLGNG